MKKEKLIYEILISEGELTTKNLNANKFYPCDLTKLVKNGFLIRTKRGAYSLGNYDGLIKYGQELMDLNELERAKKCFDICVAASFDSKELISAELLLSVKTKEYSEVFNLIDLIYSYEDKNLNKDANLYLFLMSMFTEIPEKDKEFARYLKFEDSKLEIDDDRFLDINKQNDIRKAIFSQRFTFAIKLIKEELKNNNENNLYFDIINELVEQVLVVVNKDRKIVLDLIKQKNYKGLADFLTEKSEKQNLNSMEKMTLELSNIYNKIIEENVVPVPTVIKKAVSIEQAVSINDFAQALKMSDEYIKRYNIDPQINPINLILKNIQELMANFKSNVKVQKPYEVTTNSKVKNSHSENDIFENFIYCLFTNDIDNAYVYLKQFMNGKNKSQYTSYILNLIELNILDGDLTFKDSILAVSLIIRDNYEFKISQYVEEFYESMAKKEYKKARIYLNILTNSQIFGVTCPFTDILEKLLNSESPEKIKGKVRKSECSEVAESFTYDSSKYYGLLNLDKVVFMMRDGKKLEYACGVLGMTDEQVSILKLVFAREYFINGNYEKGMEYLQMLKIEKESSEVVKSIYEEINRNRKFYSITTPESEKGLILLP